MARNTESDGRERCGLSSLLVELVEGPDVGLRYECAEARPLTLGAADDNDVVLRDPQASRYHLELSRTPEGVHVQDLGSLNGTWFAGARVHSAVVTPGPLARLRLGQSVLRVLDGAVLDDAAGASNRGAAVPAIEGLVYVGGAMTEVAAAVHRLGASRVTCLIRGETGTGKEVVARAIHRLGVRADGPFEVVDCGSLPATLVASEFFGHERGAFTGADRQRIGAFERAHGGTVFLDEIGELPLAVQPALLGVLERRQFKRLGGETPIDVDVRVICATHRDLRRAVNDGSFRADLYYRLAVGRLMLPALRERVEDIEPLVAAFVRELTGEPGATVFGPATLEALRKHPWKGNVRELRNVVESALALGRVHLARTDDGEARAPLGEAALSSSEGALPYRDARQAMIERFERSYLEPLIERCEGNASKAAREADMDRNYLVSLLRKHGLRE